MSRAVSYITVPGLTTIAGKAGKKTLTVKQVKSQRIGYNKKTRTTRYDSRCGSQLFQRSFHSAPSPE